MRPNSGFTLIEITMVLVLLGILAAVAVPKYIDHQKAADQRAALASVAEAQARLDAAFGEKLLAGKSCTQARNELLDLKTIADNPTAATNYKNIFGSYFLYPTGFTENTMSLGIKTVAKNAAVNTKTYLTYPTCKDAPSIAALMDEDTEFKIKFAIQAGIASGGMTWQYNSTYGKGTGGQIGVVNGFFGGQDKIFSGEDDITAGTWAFMSFGYADGNSTSKNIADGLFVWTDAKIPSSVTSDDPIFGQSIAVMVYDTKTKTYSVAEANIVKDTGSDTRPVLWLGSTMDKLTNYKAAEKDSSGTKLYTFDTSRIKLDPTDFDTAKSHYESLKNTYPIYSQNK